MHDEFYDDDNRDYELAWDHGELHKHKKGDKVKWIFTVIAFVLVAVMLVGLCLQAFGTGKQKSSEWFGGETDADKKRDEADDGKEQMRIAPLTVSASTDSVTRYEIGAEIPTQPVTLQAVITPENTTNKNVEWTVAWKDPSAEWATGKTVTDYVSLTQDGTDSRTVIVTCLQVFCSQIEITATSEDNEELKASCTVDYNKRITGVWNVHFNYSRTPTNASYVLRCLNFDDVIGAGIEFKTGDGTTVGDPVYDFALYGLDRLVEVMQGFSCSGRPVTPKTYEGVMGTGDPEKNRKDHIIFDSAKDNLRAPTFKFTEDWFYEHICNIPRTWFTSDEQWQAAYDRLYEYLTAYSNDYDTYSTPENSLLDGIFTVRYNGIDYIYKCKVPLKVPVKIVNATAVDLTQTGIAF